MKSKIIKCRYIAITACMAVLLQALPYSSKAQKALPLRLNPALQALTEGESTDGWLDFRRGTVVKPLTIFSDLKKAFDLRAEDQMKIRKTEKDNIGFTHYHYQQYYKNLKVLYGEYIVHEQPDSFVKSANGRMINRLNLGNVPSVNETNALAAALQFMGAGKYLWQNAGMENELKRLQKNSKATYYPKGELVYAPANDVANFAASAYRLAWQFKIYPDDPKLAAKMVYVDALTGKVVHHTDISMNCSGGSGTSTFNGNVSLNTSSFFNRFYLSHNDCQPTNIYVYNCKGGAAINASYTDSDNIWTDQSAVQAQFGAQMTYNYYLGEHGRTSWDDAGSDMIAYNNAYLGQNNACWGCTENSTIYYAGSSTSPNDDWNSDDIVGHEFTHGVTQSTAGLIYANESGALNESFSDIFGEMVESWAEGSCDYLVGADRGAIRSFINPADYFDYGGIMPDTYLGKGWYTGTLDHGGVHHNSSVQNHWFYLLSEGGSGTTGFGQPYSVTGITYFKARLIAYRALTQYLNESSQYIDARKASLEAAYDIYGQCSPEMIAVGDAWHAVGVESQLPQYAKEACGTYSSGEFVQAISQVIAANGCITTVNSATDIVKFTARDRVILYPGFNAVSGSRFIAYLEPCSSAMFRSSNSRLSGIPMSAAEKGIKPLVPIHVVPAGEESKNIFNANDGLIISPNPFYSVLKLSINAKQDIRGRVEVFNTMGEKVKKLPPVNLIKGPNKISLNGADLKSGVYMVEIYLGDVKTVKKIVKL